MNHAEMKKRRTALDAEDKPCSIESREREEHHPVPLAAVHAPSNERIAV